MAAIVSLKASIEAWEQVDALLRQTLDAYAGTLGQLEQHLSRQAAERFGVEGLDFSPQRAALTRGVDPPAGVAPALDLVGREVESELRSFAERLCRNVCSSQDLRDVASALDQAIAGILSTGEKHAESMRATAGRLKAASESENVTALRILVRYQSAELVRLADDAARASRALAASLSDQVGELTAGLKVAQREARQDTLTGLLNRRALEEIMAEFREADSQGRTSSRCLILIDLDPFKSINDRFGYLAGDELLRQVAVRIQSALLPSCTAARWGGDEFIVLVDGSLSIGMSVAQQLDQRLRARYRLGDGRLSDVFAQASVGLSDWKSGDDADRVIQRADQALKSRKRQSA